MCNALVQQNVICGCLEGQEGKQVVVLTLKDSSTMDVVYRVAQEYRVTVKVECKVYHELEQLSTSTLNCLAWYTCVLQLRQLDMTLLEEGRDPKFIFCNMVQSGNMACMKIAYFGVQVLPNHLMIVLHTSPAIYRMQLVERGGEVCGEAYQGQDVMVLPRLSKCRMISNVSAVPLDADPLNSSEDFSRYWMDVHGILLPDDFEGYVQVRFGNFGKKTLQVVYPTCCVVKKWEHLPRASEIRANDIVQRFLSVLQKAFQEQHVLHKLMTIEQGLWSPERKTKFPRFG